MKSAELLRQVVLQLIPVGFDVTVPPTALAEPPTVFVSGRLYLFATNVAAALTLAVSLIAQVFPTFVVHVVVPQPVKL